MDNLSDKTKHVIMKLSKSNIMSNLDFYDREQVDALPFDSNNEITLESLFDALPINDFTWFYCNKVAATKEAVQLAIDCAEFVLPIFESERKDDNRPSLAIEAAKKCLEDPIDENRATARAAGAAAGAAAAGAAGAAAGAAAAGAAWDTTVAANWDAARVATAAWDAARSAAGAAAAGDAARSAAGAAMAATGAAAWGIGKSEEFKEFIKLKIIRDGQPIR